MTSHTLADEGVAGERKPADPAGIRSAIDAYATSWLTNDPEAVIRMLTEDAVLIPHHGVPPVEGAAAIRTFWWPEGGSPTTITAFTMTADEVGGSCDLGFARGRFSQLHLL